MRALKDIITRGLTHNDLGLMKPIGSERAIVRKHHINALPWAAPELVTQTHPSSEVSDAYSLAFMMNDLLKLKVGCISENLDAGLIRWMRLKL